MKRIIASTEKIISDVCPDCFLTPFTKVSTVTPAGVEFGFEDGAEGAKSVEAFPARELDVEFLQVARGDVVEAGVAEDVGGGVFIRRANCEQRRPMIDGEFAFVVHALRNRRQDDRFFWSDH